MVEIIPAIMPESFSDLETKLALVAGHVSSVQLDIMDGDFVPPKTWPYVNGSNFFGPLLSESQGLPYWDKLDFEIDLMVSNPEKVIDDWITAGAARIIVHIESSQDLRETVRKFRERFAYPVRGEKADIELGLALNIITPTDVILPYLEDIDFVQFMGIDRIGYQGEVFDENVIDKIRQFHNNHPEVVISIDGGVSIENAKELVDAGAKRLVSGSAIFESDNIVEALDHFKNLVM
jgi:ribulose-phosphate 3-epimerase